MKIARPLIALGATLFAAGFWIALFLAPQVVGLALAALLALCLLVDVVRHVRRRDDDCGYGSTPFGVAECDPRPDTHVVHTPAAALTVISGDKRAVWPNEAGAPE